MSLSLSLNTALTGLQTQQAGLQLVSNNIANAATPGYTRKDAETSARVLAGLGSGVELGSIRRTVDTVLLREIQEALSLSSTDRVAQPFFRQIQDLFGQPGDNTSIGATLTELSGALEALAATPEGPTQRIEVINAALKVVNQLAAMSDQIQRLRGDAEVQLTGAIDEVNNQLQIIADLNDEIKQRVATGQSAAEFLDKRDSALDKLASYVNIQTFERSTGEVVIFTTQGTLLDTFPNFLSHTSAQFMAANTSYANGDIDGVSLNNRDITNTLTSGELKGLIDMRDSTLPGLQDEIDRLAATLRDEVNALHNKGVAFPPAQQLTGGRLFGSANDVVAVSGTLRFAVVDATGKVPDNIATAQPFSVDLSALTAPVTLSDVVNAINTQAAASPPQVIQAQLVANGAQFQLQISTLSSSAYLVFDEGDSAVTSFTPNAGIAQSVQLQNGNAPGFSNFFGLNDFFTSPGFDTGSATIAGVTRAMAVRQDLINNPTLLSRASAAMTFPLTGGESLVAVGDNSTVQALAAKFDEKLTFAAAGNLPGVTTSLAGYGAEIVFESSTAAVRSEKNAEIQEALRQELKFRSDSLSGVNIDEELAQMIVIQQAYSASARLISTVQDLFAILQQMVR